MFHQIANFFKNLREGKTGGPEAQIPNNVNNEVLDALQQTNKVGEGILQELRRRNELVAAQNKIFEILLASQCERGIFDDGELEILEGYCPQKNAYITSIKDQIKNIWGSKITGTIPAYIFKNAPQLEDIDLHGDELGFNIGEGAFANCKNLNKVFLFNCTSIGDCAFNGTGVTSIEANYSNCKTIGDYAFDSCKKLDSINLGNSVEKLGVKVFDECVSLQTITLSKTVTIEGEKDQKEGYFPQILGNLASIQTIKGPKRLERLADAYGCAYESIDE